MADGIRFVGKDPAGLAKAINVDDTGSIKTVLQASENTIGSVNLIGSPEVLGLGNYAISTPLAIGAGETTYIVASPGHLAKLDYFGCYISAPTGATSGTHRLILALGENLTALQILSVTAPYNVPIHIVGGVVIGAATVTPSTDKYVQAILLKENILGETTLEGMYVRYSNSTDAVQTNTRSIRARYTEWPIA